MSTIAAPRATHAARAEHSPALDAHVRSFAAQSSLCEGQRVLAALLTRSFEEYARPFRLLPVLLSVVFAGLLAFACFAVFFVVGHFIVGLGSVQVANGFIVVLSGLMVGTGFWMKSSYYESDVMLSVDEEKRLDHLRIGRLDDLLNTNRVTFPLLLLCVLLFLHTAVLRASPNVLDMEQSVGTSLNAAQCLMLALDNALRGLLLDTLEVYQVQVFPHPIELSAIGKPVFLAFRYVETGFAVILLLALWQRRRLVKHIRTFPRDNSAESLADWIESLCRSTDVLHRRYGDEVLFLTIAEEYIRGNTQVVKMLTHQFNQAYVSNEVRDLFRTGEDEPLFEPKAAAG
ncbi:MAG TPA: hypothetical protein VHG08_01165 [Longimicrobium sp.]|nr:hypothetical protein [Longimicrobium sp.]